MDAHNASGPGPVAVPTSTALAIPARPGQPGDARDLVAAAMNEHGFLLQHLIRKKLVGEPRVTFRTAGASWLPNTL